MTAQSETILEVVAAKICRGDTFLLASAPRQSPAADVGICSAAKVESG